MRLVVRVVLRVVVDKCCLDLLLLLRRLFLNDESSVLMYHNLYANKEELQPRFQLVSGCMGG